MKLSVPKESTPQPNLAARKNSTWLLLALTIAVVSVRAAEDRDTKVRKDRELVKAEGHWIYNDLAQGLAQATSTGKPLLVVFRCIP